MATNNKQNKTSLEKSHSAWSNTKLTFLAVETVLVYTALWAVIALTVFHKLTGALAYILIGACAAVTVLNFLAFNKFKR